MRPEQAMGIRLVMRHYFSSYLLWGAEHLASLAGDIEEAHEGRSRFDIAHASYVLNSILCAASFLEAMVNELFQDAHDGHGIKEDGYIAPLSQQARNAMAEIWRGTDEGTKMRPLGKYQLLLTSAGLPPMDRGSQPFQDAHLVVQLRNAIAHYQPEDVAGDWTHRMADRLRGKFPDNRLMAGSGNPWWPSHCLGHGCAAWATRSVLALTEHVSAQLGISPNYERMRRNAWAGFGVNPQSGR